MGGSGGGKTREGAGGCGARLRMQAKNDPALRAKIEAEEQAKEDARVAKRRAEKEAAMKARIEAEEAEKRAKAEEAERKAQLREAAEKAAAEAKARTKKTVKGGAPPPPPPRHHHHHHHNLQRRRRLPLQCLRQRLRTRPHLHRLHHPRLPLKMYQARRLVSYRGTWLLQRMECQPCRKVRAHRWIPGAKRLVATDAICRRWKFVLDLPRNWVSHSRTLFL